MLIVLNMNLNLIATTLRNARAARGLSLRKAEKLSGISNARISQLETGHNINLKVETLHKLAKAYGITFTVGYHH